MAAAAARPLVAVRQYGAGHGHGEHGHHPPPKSMADEFGQPIEYDKDGNKITGQDPFFYAEVRILPALVCAWLTCGRQRGAKRELESWEVQYYAVVALAFAIAIVVLATREDTSLTTWAQEEILRRRSQREKQVKEA